MTARRQWNWPRAKGNETCGFFPLWKPHSSLFDCDQQKTLTRRQKACGSKELNPPFPFPPSGESRGGRVPPTPEARCAPAQNAGTHRCCRLPPQEGLPPPCGSPAGLRPPAGEGVGRQSKTKKGGLAADRFAPAFRLILRENQNRRSGSFFDENMLTSVGQGLKPIQDNLIGTTEVVP